jgi:hypothetical protein
VQLTTFSAPSVGDAKFQWAFDSRVPSTRIWLDGDPITQERINSPVGVPVRVPWTSDNGLVKAKGVDLNSHEPRNLRRDLIKQWRRDYPSASMTDVPANTGDEDSLEPWKVFTSYWQMLTLLKGSAGASLRAQGALAGFAQDFAQNFRGYEAQLSPIVAREESRSAAQALDAFQQGLPTAAQMQTMKDNLAYNLFDFVCICYALCEASNTQSLAAYDPASNRILADEKLK